MISVLGQQQEQALNSKDFLLTVIFLISWKTIFDLCRMLLVKEQSTMVLSDLKLKPPCLNCSSGIHLSTVVSSYPSFYSFFYAFPMRPPFVLDFLWPLFSFLSCLPSSLSSLLAFLQKWCYINISQVSYLNSEYC